MSTKSAASCCLRQHRIELVELRRRRVVVRKSGGTLHPPDDWIKCTVGVLRRAEIAQACVWSARELFQQRRRQPRLAYACLAGKEHYLALASLRLRPAPQQQFEFFLASDEFSHAACVESLKPAFD
jgi:hypothetical protein